MKVGVVGAGAWGTALSFAVARGGNDVILWSFDGALKEFDGVDVPYSLSLTTDMAYLADADAWLVVTPAAFFRATMFRAKNCWRGQPIIICTKGAEDTTGCFMSEIMHDVMPESENLGVLSGPQFAGEVAAGVPTGSTIAGNATVIKVAKQVLNQLYLVESDDIIGAEICGVGKNAVALINGFNSVASAGENETALIFTRAWNEIMQIGLASGAKIETFLALCGIGDLFLSATSPTSRNYSGGMAIARGNAPAGTVEGIFALGGLIARAERKGVPVPTLFKMRKALGL